MNRPNFIRRDDYDEFQFERLVDSGISAAKCGDRAQARTLLSKAAEMNPNDSRPWLWLSSTTDDVQQQREYLEYAVAADPNNSAARRGLVLLSDKLDKTRLLAEGEEVQPRHPAQPEEARAVEEYICPKCGGQMRYQVKKAALTCSFCGYVQVTESHNAADSGEQALDFILPTTRGHRWSEAQHRLNCAQCGAVALWPVAQSASQCPYCGSGQLIESSETVELVDPNCIGVAKIDAEQAANLLNAWLKKDSFAPDDLRRRAQTSALRPAYYPFWTFDGTLDLQWTCEVNEGTSRNPNWVARNGHEFEMFDDILVPALRSITQEELDRMGPFNLKDVVDFSPAYLAGWTTLAYDFPLAEASLLAREKVVHKVRNELFSRVEIGAQKRNVHNGAVNWSGMTFKNVLLPIWMGTYRYRDNTYTVMINGQTGKVTGDKPRDSFKLVTYILLVGLTGITLLLALLFLGLHFGWFKPF